MLLRPVLGTGSRPGRSSDGRTLYGRRLSSSSALAEREPEVRPEELVRRADEHVDVPRGDVDRPVRAVVDGVGPGERAGVVGELDDARDVRAACRPRSTRPGTRPRASAPRAATRGRRGRARGRRARRRSGRRRRDPRRARATGDTFASWSSRVHDDLVALAQRPAERAREQEVERRHALPERDLVRVAGEEPGRRVAATVRSAPSCARSSRTARRCSRCPRAGSGRSRRSPRPGTACRRARRRTRAPRSSAVKRARTVSTSSTVVLTRPPRR